MDDKDNKDEFNSSDDNFGLSDFDLDPLDDSADEFIDDETTSNQDDFEYDSDDEYDDDDDEGSNSGKVIGIVVLILLVGAGLSYFLYLRPAQQAEAEKAKQEQIAIEKANEEKQRIEAEKERLRQEEEERLQAEEAAKNAKPKIGVIEEISERTNRYYIVVSSNIDGDLAMDWAKKQIRKGINIKLLAPRNNKFYRLTVADYDTWTEAENSLNELKSTYGNDIWVLKY